MATRLWLVRHGESEANAAGIVQGQLDFALNDAGRKQARAVAARLAKLGAARLVTSPLLRARETAAEIAAATGLLAETDDRLMEYDYGERSGLTLEEARQRFGALMDARDRGKRPVFPGEEGRDKFHGRVESVIRDLADLDRDTIVVTHGGVMSAICYTILGLDPGRSGLFRPRNGAVTVIASGPAGQLVIERHNDACHLAGIPAVEFPRPF